jgi:hypothetical protein
MIRDIQEEYDSAYTWAVENERANQRLLRAAAAALERCQVATDPSGAADEAAAILEEVVTLEGQYIPPSTNAVSEEDSPVISCSDCAGTGAKLCECDLEERVILRVSPTQDANARPATEQGSYAMRGRS